MNLRAYTIHMCNYLFRQHTYIANVQVTNLNVHGNAMVYVCKPGHKYSMYQCIIVKFTMGICIRQNKVTKQIIILDT